MGYRNFGAVGGSNKVNFFSIFFCRYFDPVEENRSIEGRNRVRGQIHPNRPVADLLKDRYFSFINPILSVKVIPQSGGQIVSFRSTHPLIKEYMYPACALSNLKDLFN